MSRSRDRSRARNAVRAMPFNPAHKANLLAWYTAATGVTLGATPLATGTTPPAVTIAATDAGQPTASALRIEITTGGARGTALFKWSTNDGTTFEATGVATAATVALASANITVTFPVGTYNTDNVYRATISQLNDRQSGAYHMTQPTMANQPVRLGAGINGHSTIVCDGVDDHMSNAVENSVTEYTIFAAMRFSSIAGQYAIWSNRHLVAPGGGTVMYLGIQAGVGKLFLFQNTASISGLLTSNAFVANQWGIAELAVDATGRSLALNGTLAEDAATATGTKIPSGYLWRDSGVYTPGQSGDVAMWTRRLSVDERSIVRQWFGRRYGVAVTP
jgi:hypothetical protein